RRTMHYAPSGKPGGGVRSDLRTRSAGLGDIPALHVDIGSGRTNARNGLLGLGGGMRAAGQYDPATARRGHPRGKEQPEPTQAARDYVGAVVAKDPSPLRRHYHSAAPLARYGQDEFAGVLRRAHQRNCVGRLDKWIGGVLKGLQLTVSDEPVYRTQKVLDLLGMADTHQRQVHIVEREVAAEGI